MSYCLGRLNCVQALVRADDTSWWNSLSPVHQILFYVGIFVVLVVVGTAFLQDYEKSFPRKCPQCGEVLKQRELGETTLRIGGKRAVSQTDLIEWSCEACGWKVQRGRGAPAPYR